MDLLAARLVQPLHDVENEFLQVVLTQFRLTRQGEGVQLEVEFDETTPTIWRRAGKSHIREEIARATGGFAEAARAHQEKLDAVLYGNQTPGCAHNDGNFPFRFASGGTLPIVRMKDRHAPSFERDYYCLLYREIFPIGWNIANGGCDTRDELLDPTQTIERELREELLIFDLVHKERYVFSGDAEKPLDLPEFRTARRFWQEKLPQYEFADFEERDIPVKWLNGPDSIVIRARLPREQVATVTGCFLNINAVDFGIEVDRVAHITVDRSAVICDGELTRGVLVNAPVGLFPVEDFDQAYRGAGTHFVPEYVYYDGIRFDGRRLEEVVAMYVRDVSPLRSERTLEEWRNAEKKFDLCPVTRSIVRRYVSPTPSPIAPGAALPGCDAFVCFGSEDAELATRVFQALEGMGLRVFFSKETPQTGHLPETIYRMLDEARYLVAVASHPQHLLKPHPRFEYTSFHWDMLSDRKRSGQILPFISGFDAYDLPRPLRYFAAVECRPSVDSGIQELIRRVR